jgi:hypothetical protein
MGAHSFQEVKGTNGTVVEVDTGILIAPWDIGVRAKMYNYLTASRCIRQAAQVQ